MSLKNDYWAIGYVKRIYPIDIIGEFKKREFVIRNIYKKNKKWHVTDMKFVATGDAIEELSLIDPGLEVTVLFRIKTRYWEKDGELQVRDGKEIMFLELSAWKVFSHSDRKAKDYIWEKKDFEWVNPNDAPDIENTPRLTDTDKRERQPDTADLDIKKYVPGSMYSGPEDDDLPF